MTRTTLAIMTLALAATTACAPQDGGEDAPAHDPMAEEPVLGPVDGGDLPPTDLDRVQTGQEAPDFTLTSLAGPPVTLSDFRGQKDVVLVFYRGHW